MSIAPPIIHLGHLGRAYALAGRPEDASSQKRALESMGASGVRPDYQIALIETGLGQHEAAIHSLERAFARRSLWLAWVEPAFRPLHTNPAFRSLVRRVGFPD